MHLLGVGHLILMPFMTVALIFSMSGWAPVMNAHRATPEMYQRTHHAQRIVTLRDAMAILVQRGNVIQLEAVRICNQLAAACAVRVGRPYAQPCCL